jgi:VWFA-related protein
LEDAFIYGSKESTFMPRLVGLILAATLIFASSSFSHPEALMQQPPPAHGGYRFKVAVNSVLLNVSVRNRTTNRGIPNLRKEDFVVYEDGTQQQVDQLMPSDAPFSSLLLIDNSGSTRTYLPLMKAAAVDFTRQLKANDRVAIATFNSLVELAQDFTGDRALAARAIGNIDSIGGTAFYDALMTCIDVYLRDIAERSAIVVFTDGVDNQLEGQNTEGSRTLFSELFRRIQEIDPIIYTIFLNPEAPAPAGHGGGMPRMGPGIGWPFPRPGGRPAPGPTRPSTREIYDKARNQLFTIADQTGGRMYTLTKAEDLTRVYREIAEDLRVQYLLAYTPNNHARDGMWHDIRIRVKDRPEATVRTRKGYYAQRISDLPR